jgi:hypothetical protein
LWAGCESVSEVLLVKEQSSKSKVQRAKFKEQRAKSKVQRAKFKVQSSKSKVQRAKFKEQSSKFKVQRAKFKVQSSKMESPTGMNLEMYFYKSIAESDTNSEL